jgi:transcriptional antiterminator NusG
MKQWFIVHVYSGQEYKIVNILKEKLASYISDNKIEEILVPTKKTTKLSKKGKVEVERKIYPGYVVLHMEPEEELFKIIARTPGILSFGKRGRVPQPITEEEKDRMFGYIKPGVGKAIEIPFTKGESVKITDGPFADFTGIVEEIYPDKERVKLMVTIFGRQTPVEVSFFQVESI